LRLFTDTQKKILAVLADGGFHSGTTLAHVLHISRSAVWKHLQSLSVFGIEIIALTGKGYKLAQPLELLSTEKITADLSPLVRSLISTLEIYPQIDSTNRYLVELAHANAKTGSVCFAESQTAGKGRQGRQWVSPFGKNIYMSILWRIDNDLSCLSGLSLAVGVAVVRTLKTLGINDIGLKWPNDIVWQGKKLAGILIEVSGEASGQCSAVIGLGLNLALPDKQAVGIEQPWTDLQQITPGASYSRNTVASALLNQLLPVIADFETDTLSHYLAEWRSYDANLGKQVSVYLGKQRIDGLVCGINEQGLLLLKNAAGEIKTFASGEISFRAA
jgi:BirA family biotin operon repressor/biotin-[acetyl-CoA-carboxylase] ligase